MKILGMLAKWSWPKVKNYLIKTTQYMCSNFHSSLDVALSLKDKQTNICETVNKRFSDQWNQKNKKISWSYIWEINDIPEIKRWNSFQHFSHRNRGSKGSQKEGSKYHVYPFTLIPDIPCSQSFHAITYTER